MSTYETGAVLFTINMDDVSHFYEKVVGLRVHRAGDDHVVLENGTFRLTIHQIPEQYAKKILISKPPVVRESSAIKLSFLVDDIARARPVAAQLGGMVYPPEREWRGESTTTCAGYDPDGNVFQLFQRKV